MISSDTYAEVYEILSYMDKFTVMKIPVEILENIRNNRNKNYISNIDPNNLFNMKNINKQTIEVLACLDINYWMNEEKKKTLKKKYIEKQNSLKFNSNVFENKKITNNIIINDKKNVNSFANSVKYSVGENVEIIKFKRKNLIQNIFNRILSFFRKK